MSKALAWLRGILQSVWDASGEPVIELPPLSIAGQIRKMLMDRIAAYDRLVEDFADFPLDRESFNIVSHELRAVREKLDALVRAQKAM